MSKIRIKKVVLFYDKYVNSTIMVDSFYWNSIGSWFPTHKNLLLAHFLIRPILYPKFPLMTRPPKWVIFGPDSVEITDISTGNIIAKGAANHASKAYDFSHFMPFSELVHSQQPLAREGKIIASTSFAASTSIADPCLSVYELRFRVIRI